MTDTIRTRIANAAGDFLSDNFHAYLEQDVALELADAVIAELGLEHVIDYCERQAGVGWRDVGTADEAMGRNTVAESVLNILEGVTQNG